MNSEAREYEFWNIAKAVLADALAKGVLTPKGEAFLGGYSTVLDGDISTKVMVTWFFSPQPAHNLPAAAYLSWTPWPDEPDRRLRGFCTVAFRHGHGWDFYGNSWRWVAAWIAALKRLPDYAKTISGHQCETSSAC